MNVYLAARFSRRFEMRAVRSQLVVLGHVVTSRWIDRDHHPDDSDITIANEDLVDLEQAHLVISFTEVIGSHPGRNRGGRHVEFGVALASGKRLIVVGPRENVFHSVRSVEHFETWEEALTSLRSVGITEN